MSLQGIKEGRIIEYIDQGKVVCAFCLQDKGTRLHLLTSLNRQVNLPPKRALLISSDIKDLSSPREEILQKLKQAETRRNRLKEEVRVKDLWELIQDEKESFDYPYLAQLCFGEVVTDDHISALVRALFDDKLYFKMKDGRFIPHSVEKVEEIIRLRQEEAEREEALGRASRCLREALMEGAVENPQIEPEIIHVIVDLALYGKDAPEYGYGKELLSRIGYSDISKAREILIKLRVWEEDEPVDLLRFHIRKSFTDDLLHESGRLNTAPMDFRGYEDLRELAVFTIDGPQTRDFDDALSVEMDKDHIRIGIHISDVAGVIEAGCGLDKEAALRGSSLYLPRRQISMFPDELSHDRLSLRQGLDRPVLSLLTCFDKTGNLCEYRIAPAVINVKRQLTYDAVNEQYEGDDLFSGLHRLCVEIRKKRIENGALILSLPEVAIHLEEDSSVSLEMVSQDTPSRMMVAELMILYNWLMARFAVDHHIPVFYRCQKEPSEKLPVEDTDYVYYVFRQRRKLHPLVIDVKPGSHAGLGLDVYSNLSSPIRRYFDLVSQRQVRNFLFHGAPLYNREELEEIRLKVAPSLKDLDTVKRNRTRYWVLKYFQQHTGEEFPATVLDVMKSRFRIILMEHFLIAEMKREAGQDFSPGEGIMVRVKKSDPWENQLKLEYAGSR